jgi:hypothetical protein
MMLRLPLAQQCTAWRRGDVCACACKVCIGSNTCVCACVWLGVCMLA